jgi:hypothetical protein
MVTNTRQIFNPAASDQHYGVLLEIMADSGNIGGNLNAVSQADAGNLS